MENKKYKMISRKDIHSKQELTDRYTLDMKGRIISGFLEGYNPCCGRYILTCEYPSGHAAPSIQTSRVVEYTDFTNDIITVCTENSIYTFQELECWLKSNGELDEGEF